MFEISELKAKTLVELQQIAKTNGLKKISQLKKLELIYQILDTQATHPKDSTVKNRISKAEQLKLNNQRLNDPKEKGLVKLPGKEVESKVAVPKLEVKKEKVTNTGGQAKARV